MAPPSLSFLAPLAGRGAIFHEQARNNTAWRTSATSTPRSSTTPYRFSQHVHRDRHARKDAQQLFDIHAPPDSSPLWGSRPRHLVRPYTLPNVSEPAVQGAKPATPYDHAKYGARAEVGQTAFMWREEREAG